MTRLQRLEKLYDNVNNQAKIYKKCNLKHVDFTLSDFQTSLLISIIKNAIKSESSKKGSDTEDEE